MPKCSTIRDAESSDNLTRLSRRTPRPGDLLVEILGAFLTMQRLGGDTQVEDLVVGQRSQLGQRGAHGATGRDVVGDDKVELVLDVAVQLVELETQEACFDSEFDDHRLDLLGDAQNHLAALQHRGDVAEGNGILQLRRRETEHGVLEADLVTLECLQCLVRPVEQAADVLQLVLGSPGVEVDDPHLLTRRDDRHLQRLGDTLGGAVPCARLARRHRGIGHEVDVGSGNAIALG